MESNAQIQNPRDIPFEWETELDKHEVPLKEFTIALPKGAFPEIDYPDFLGKKEGLNSYLAKEPVLAIELEGEAKAYPLNVLTVHELSNDTLSGVPILPTYCPLCNSGIVFDRRLEIKGEEEVLEFEVSGMLRNSDMVMLDRRTESLWQQLTGEALVGTLSGKRLDIIPSIIISVDDFFERFPEGEILSPETGEASDRYGTNPYVDYDEETSRPMAKYFDHDRLTDRLPPMERVIDVSVDGSYKIYPWSALKEHKVINDTFKDQAFVLFYKRGTISILDEHQIKKSKDIGTAVVFDPVVDGRTLTFEMKDGQFVDEQTQSVWDITGRCVQGELKGTELSVVPHSQHFAFAWLSFHPESKIYK